jgi:DNA adenine methylase
MIPKPILKWVGGKTQIIETLIKKFPRHIDNYHEIFLGGGSVLFAFIACIREGAIHIDGGIYAYDINEPLIYIYINIQSNHTHLYEKLREIIVEFNECIGEEVNRKPETIEIAKASKENYYYWIRGKYNQLSREEKRTILGSAYFIFLNKTCFRGVFRVGPNGFNVPFGHYKNPEIINREHLNEIHEWIQGVVFEVADFNVSLQRMQSHMDFAYLDPPYVPETATSFVGYTENGFSVERHRELFTVCDRLTDTGKKIMMSNADMEMVRTHFTENKYTIESIVCKRSIHSKNPDAKAKEVIIRNYTL